MRVHQHILVLIILATVWGLASPPHTNAQSISPQPIYWQHTASGRITAIYEIDLERDGASEFALVVADRRVELVRGDGSLVWEQDDELGRPIVGLTAFANGVAVATDQAVTYINAVGETEWRVAVEPDNAIMQLTVVQTDGDETVLLLQLADGTLARLDAQGERLWTYTPATSTTPPVEGRIRSLAGEIVYSYETQRGFSRVDLIGQSGAQRWSEALDRVVTAVAVGSFSAESSLIAIGNSGGALALLDQNKHPVWTTRTLNRPIVDVTFAEWQSRDKLLIVATDVGKLVAYDRTGRRQWDKAICRQADGLTLRDAACSNGVAVTIEAIDPPPERQSVVALAVRINDGEATTILLLDRAHNIVAQHGTTPIARQPLLSDTNGDGISEVALPNFGSLALLSTPTAARSTQELTNQSYSLGAEPSSFLAHDFDHDGVDDLILGGQDGRLHRINLANNAENWILAQSGYAVADLSVLRTPAMLDELVPSLASLNDPPDLIAVAYNRLDAESRQGDAALVDLRRVDGSTVWTDPLRFDARISNMLVLQSPDSAPLLLFALESGQIIGYQLLLDEFNTPLWRPARLDWEILLGRSVDYMTLLQRTFEPQPRIVVALESEIRRYSLTGILVDTILVGQPGGACTSPADMLALIDAGAIAQQTCLDGLRLDGWISELGAPLAPPLTVQTRQYTYRPNSRTSWQRTNTQPLEDGQDRIIPGVEPTIIDDVTAFYAGDILRRGQTDFIIGSSDGTIRIDLSESAESALSIVSAVRGIAALNTRPGEPANLAVIGENSRVSFFQFQPNYPPLLSAPIINSDETLYAIQTTVIDIEAQPITARLETLDPATGLWEDKGEKTTTGTVSKLEWALDPPAHSEPLSYRIIYIDGDDHLHTFVPPPGPIAIQADAVPLSATSTVLAFAAGLLVIALLVYFIWNQPTNQARRFYNRLRQSPETALMRLREHYNESSTGAKLFANVASIARLHNDEFIASLADGLYLLAEQPTPSLQIFNAILSDSEPDHTIFQLLEWRTMFAAASALMQASSTAELGLLRGQLDELLALRDQYGNVVGVFARLVPSFNSLQDSTRVTTPEDRLVFLNDADSLLRRLNNENNRAAPYLSRVLISAITNRWQTLVATEMESLRGRARLEARLATTRLVPSAESQITVELTNQGRATAEEIEVTLQEGVVATTNGATQRIQSLAPNGKRLVEFTIALPPQERFRLAFKIVYSDRQRTAQSFEYANMVTVLTPNAEFVPIKNPYSPGTPLRRDSALFFGRIPLFNFIAREAERVSQQHVLILVGQRRTGKTSALLRLNRHLPSHLIPIYIDCQSLGVVPGMTAFFQDIAWQIADTLLEYDVDIEVPDLAELKGNPGHWFQHTFIPNVRGHLAPGTKLVLVFDEFEAFENLTNDGILPRTIFSYLRHLMQHGEGLSFIFVGTHKLEEMTTDYWSVLFNIALYQAIDFLDEQAALELITKPVEPNLVYDDLAINKIWRLTAGHPYFLQLVCYSLVKRANEQKTSYVTISDVNETVNEMLGLGEVHFAYIWQRSTSAERTILIALAHLIDTELPFRTSMLVDVLRPYQTNLTPGEISLALEKLVQRNIMRVLHDGVQAQYELKIGLVGAWIERSKTVSQLAQEQLLAAAD